MTRSSRSSSRTISQSKPNESVLRSIFEPASAATRVEQLLEVALGPDELAGRHRLEDDGRDAGRLQPELDLERDARGREREQAVPGDGGRALPSPEQRHSLGDRAPHLARDLRERREPLLERRVIDMNSSEVACFTFVGMMKNAFIP